MAVYPLLTVRRSETIFYACVFIFKPDLYRFAALNVDIIFRIIFYLCNLPFHRRDIF